MTDAMGGRHAPRGPVPAMAYEIARKVRRGGPWPAAPDDDETQVVR